MKKPYYFKLLTFLLSFGVMELFGQVTTYTYTGATQTYTVPAGVTSIQIETSGGQGGDGNGGSGGLGATMIGSFTVTPGDVLDVVVGAQGLQYGNSGGGGAGSGVIFAGAPLIVAGGGGGGATNAAGYGGLTSTSGGSSSGAGGTAGNGGQKGYRSGDCGWAAGGGGFYGDGYGGDGGWDGGALPGTLSGTGAGQSWTSGGSGGSDGGCTFTFPNAGAWGCGGGGAGSYGGAGGGGYSGGGGGQYVDPVLANRGGGGGGSFNSGTDQTNTASNHAGNGEIIITVLCDGLTTSVSATELCDGELLTLDASSTNGGTVTWDGGVTTGVPFAPPVGTTTYTATSDHIDDCEFQVDILVNALPTVTASVDDSEVCDGESITFTGGGADSYSWDLGVTDGVAFTPAAGTATYTVTGTDAATGCQNTATVDATVYALPTVTASVDDSEVCDGESVIFNGGGADTYTWDSGVTDGVAFTAAVGTATYTVTGTDGNGCQNTATVDATVYALPTVTASVDDSEVCDGESVIFNGGGADTYTWDSGVTDGVAFTAAVGTATYTVTGTDGNGCQNTATVDATVYALPTVTASVDDSEVCDGESVIFNGGGADTYTWDLGVTDGVAFTAAVGTATYTVTGTDGNGCQNTATVDATVYALPTVTASVDDSEVCDGESVIFNGGGADTYTWDSGVTDGVAFTAAVGTATYTVTGTDGNGCQNTATVDATVYALPTVTASVDDSEVCDGESVIFNGGGADTYTWDSGVTDGVAFTAAVGTATYTVTGTDGNGCQNTATVDATVYALPTVTASVNDSEVCDGESVIFNGGGADTYTWDSGVTDGIAFTAAVGTATYTVTGTDGNGCQNTATVDATVYALPTVTASVDDSEVCDGESVIFNGGGADTYTWDLGVTDGIAFTAAVGTATYTVTGTDGNGCQNAATVDATVYALPTVTANASESNICFGESVIFNGDGATTYVWDLGVIDGIEFTPLLAGTLSYTVTGTDDNGCQNTDAVDVSVNDEIIISSTATDELYGGDGAIDISVSGGLAPYTFDWNNDGTGDFDDPEDLSDLFAGMYIVIVKDDANCSATDTINVELSCTPMTVEVSDYSICENELLTLDATSISGGEIIWDDGIENGVAFYPDTTGIMIYTATSVDGSDCPFQVEVEILPIPVVNPTVGGEVYCLGDTIVLAAGGDADIYTWDILDLTPEVGVTTYTVTGENLSTGCTNSASIDITVYDLPTVTASVDKDEICLGNTVILEGSGAESYEWDPADIINGLAYSPESLGYHTYTVTGIDENGCTNNASVEVNVVAGLELSYTVTHVAAGGDGAIDLTITGGVPSYSIDWDNDEIGDYDDDEDLSGLSNGLYTVDVIGSEGCKGNAEIWVSNTAGIEGLEQVSLEVYPNPTRDNITIEYSGNFDYTLTSINGDIIDNGTANDKKTIDLNYVADGIYFVTVNGQNGMETIKVVKQ